MVRQVVFSRISEQVGEAEEGYGCVETLTFHRGTSHCVEANGEVAAC
jgi:hypothetical protein